MTRLTSLGLHRALYISVLVSIAALFFLLLSMDKWTKASDFLIMIPEMFFSGLGLGLGAHFVILGYVPPSPPRILGAALMGGIAGAFLSPVGYLLGGGLTYLLRAEVNEGIGWGLLFLPPWIFFSGSFAIGARYLAARVRGLQLAVAPVMGALGALAGDLLMTLTLFRPIPPAPGLRMPLAVTGTLGALIAFGLAWAERGMSDGTPTPPDSPSTEDGERQ